MNRCAYQQRSAMAACEERRMMGMDSVVCPKPRRLGLLNPSLNDQIRRLKLPVNYQTEMGDSKAGSDLLEIILTKGGCGVEKSGHHVASSPPFYFGSPPSRASNPVIQDLQFGSETTSTPLTTDPPSPSSPSSSSLQGGACVRMKFGFKPAAVRIEGFDCLSRDGRNHSISAVA